VLAIKLDLIYVYLLEIPDLSCKIVCLSFIVSGKEEMLYLLLADTDLSAEFSPLQPPTPAWFS